MTDELLEANSNPKEKFWGLGYDRVFKSVFCDETIRKSNDYHLLERLIYEVTNLRLKVISILSPELSVQNTKEKTKRLDLLIECDGAFVNIELNSKLSPEIIIRNNCYFSSFYSAFTKVGKKYDTECLFIQISLNFNMGSDMKCVYSTTTLDKDFQYLFFLNEKKISH